MIEALQAVGERLRRYDSAEISRVISEHDTMFMQRDPHAIDHYLGVGRSAISIIAQAMLASGRDKFASVLDLPSGAGRITRHLAALFPDAELFVNDLSKTEEAFAAATFGATAIAVQADFSGRPAQRFDLIFCGSLLTHLPRRRFLAALSWFIEALEPDGVLVVTLHGRRACHLTQRRLTMLRGWRWRWIRLKYALIGFGYGETIRNAAGSYGTTLTAPSWVLRLFKRDPRCRILGYQEGAWDDCQDALMLQRRSVYR